MKYMKKIIIYTDGACSKNPGPGGWGAVLLYNNTEKRISGSENSTTNNQMELMAVLKSLQLLKEPCDIEIFSDSKYVCDGITSWLSNWKKNNWIGSNKQPIKNKNLWQELDNIMQIHTIKMSWVRGHSGDKYNEIADKLATGAVFRE